MLYHMIICSFRLARQLTLSIDLIRVYFYIVVIDHMANNLIYQQFCQ